MVDESKELAQKAPAKKSKKLKKLSEIKEKGKNQSDSENDN